MKKIENPNGSVTYRIWNDEVGVQQTISRCMLQHLAKYNDWYEFEIHSNLLREYIKLLHEKRRLSN